MRSFFVSIIFGILLLSCARVGSPIGGDKDTIAPNYLGSNIDTTRVNIFRNIGELRLDFDEYVTLKDINKNLNVSPSLKKITKIFPANIPTKFVLIQWEDTLKANTTYNFNFGNAIRDNNEGNVLPYFNYAFSTGEKIDDLYISGVVRDAMELQKPSEQVNRAVGLYQFQDKIDYQQKPYYITNVDEDGYFELNYLAPGKYQLIAFEDANANSIFDQGKEKVGFLKETIQLEKSISGLQINLFPTKKKGKYVESKPIPGGLQLLFEGNPTSLNIKSVSEKLTDYQVSHTAKSDTARVWFDAVKQNIGINNSDKLEFTYEIGAVKDTARVFGYKFNAKTNEMTISNQDGNLLPPQSEFRFVSNYVINKIDTKEWTLQRDSIQPESFTARISATNPYVVFVKANFVEGKKYQLTVPKGSVQSYYASNAVGKRFDFKADALQNYGSLKIKLQNKPSSKFWIQMLNADQKVEYEQYTDLSEVTFPIVKPAEYYIRILVDENGNKVWDEADFVNNTFAEEVFVFYKIMEIRPLWTHEEIWDLKDARKLDTSKMPAKSPAKVTEETPNTFGPNAQKPKLNSRDNLEIPDQDIRR